MRVFIPGLILCCALAAKEPVRWETGVVVFQTLNSVPVGAVGESSTTASMNGLSSGGWFNAQGTAESSSSVATVFGRWNTVVIQTGAYRYRLQELATGFRSLSPMRRGPANPIVLPVNQRISFYRENGAFIMLDTQRRKHFFEMLGMESTEGGDYNPDEGTAAGYYAEGEALMRQGKYLDALLDYRCALELEPLNLVIQEREKEAEDHVQ
ncbi:MAG: tetratricopeptide repeat protein [Acidobacteriia bacterium]|nr:tetratricopeptide repeat protein [Terriglobia bacterium]